MSRPGVFAAVALTAFGLSGATASAQMRRQEMREACGADYKAFCADVQPGGGRIVACLEQNAAKLSASCQKEIAAHKPAR